MRTRAKATSSEAQAVINNSVANAMGVLEDPLMEGGRLHAFRSGGGLRVVRLEYGQKLRGYGEHYDIGTALCHCAEDFPGRRPAWRGLRRGQALRPLPDRLDGGRQRAGRVDLAGAHLRRLLGA